MFPDSPVEILPKPILEWTSSSADTYKTLVFFLTSPEVLQPSRKRNVQVNHFPSLHLSYSCLCESSTARVGTVRWYRLE